MVEQNQAECLMNRLRHDTWIGCLSMVAAALVFLIATKKMLMREEPFYSWYYCFAWWSYIVSIESFLLCRHSSLSLTGSRERFILQFPMSVTVWLIFEVLNFRLNNWEYLEIVAHRAWRWLGYGISFATVLPGIFATQRLLDHLGVASRISCPPLSTPERLYLPFLAAGSLMLLFPVVWPRFFFPFVWLAFIFLLEPINHRFRGVSLLRDLQNGSPRQMVLLLIAGSVCGFLWEIWNYWAGSKWCYTIPFFGFLKIFEMPLLGFLGFPPFAVECYAMASSLYLLRDRMEKNLCGSRLTMAWVALGVMAVSFHLLVFWGIDHFTVVSFRM